MERNRIGCNGTQNERVSVTSFCAVPTVSHASTQKASHLLSVSRSSQPLFEFKRRRVVVVVVVSPGRLFVIHRHVVFGSGSDVTAARTFAVEIDVRAGAEEDNVSVCEEGWEGVVKVSDEWQGSAQKPRRQVRYRLGCSFSKRSASAKQDTHAAERNAPIVLNIRV